MYRKIHNTITNIDSTGQSEDYAFSFNNGGILLGIKLTWQPHTFLNVGTDEEIPKGGDIHCIVADSGTSAPILGFDNTFNQPIVVPQGGEWEWLHPSRDEIIAANSVIEKLQHNTAFAAPPPGFIRGALRVLARAEPVRQTPHSLMIEADFVAFDLNFT